MDGNSNDHASLLSRIEVLERERDELHKDIEQLCMQHAGPSYVAVATRMHFQRTAGLEQEIDDLKKQLAACRGENVNLQEELSEAYRIKSQLADLHTAEVAKSLEAEKQVKFFQNCVAAAFAERDNAIMEAEKAKEKEELASQKFDTLQQRIEELSAVCHEEKTLSTALQSDLEKQEKANEIFKKVVSKFYEIKQNSLKSSNDISWEDKCDSLLNDSEDMWTFSDDGETSTLNYITALEGEVEALKKSVNHLQSNLRMGLEIEKHLKKQVQGLKNKKTCLEEKMKNGISGLLCSYSQLRLDVINLLEEESSHLKSTVNIIKEKIGGLYLDEELNRASPPRDTTLPEGDCRDVHINPDAGSDIITKENDSGWPNSSTSGTKDAVEALAKALKEKENDFALPSTCTSGTGDASEVLAQALQEKVAALLLLSQQEERYLLESNVNAALQKKLEELQRNLIQVTNEKVKALMELAQLKREYQLLQEKVNDDVKQSKLLATGGEKSIVQDKDGRFKNLLKKTYLKHWIDPLDSHESEAGPCQEYAQNIGHKRSNSNMDFARTRIEYTALKQSLESMEHLTSSVHRLRLSLIKVKESGGDEDMVAMKSKTIDNVVTEAKLLKTALSSSLPVSWSAETDALSESDKVGVEDSNVKKADCVSAAGFEMAELLIFASRLLIEAMS